MFKNYLKIAVRNLRKNALYSCINVSGLAMGMTCVVLAVLFMKDELSFDRFHKKAPQLYRITTTATGKNGEKSTSGSSGRVQGPAFKAAIPEILDYVRFWNVGGFNIVGEQKAFNLQGLFADSSFFKIFSFPLLYGNPQTALSDPASIVISESTALKYFGETDVVGKILKVEEQGLQPLTITAVVKDVPPNSSIRFDVLLPFQFMESFFRDADWFNHYLSTFVLLHPEADPGKVAQKFPAVSLAKAREQLQEQEKTATSQEQLTFGLQHISGIHLNPIQQEGNIWEAGSYTTLYMLSGIAVFILLMACINFVNFSISYSLKRIKEIGVRKVNGSSRRQIIAQFLTETALLCMAAFLLAILFSSLLLPSFNSLVGRQLELHILKHAAIWMVWLGAIAASIIMAGLYPAFVFSRFNTVEALCNRQKAGGRGWLGKSLVVFQFTLAIGFIIGTMVYYSQMNFIMNKHLGYNPSGIIKIKLPPYRDPDQLVRLFRNELSGEPVILQVAGGNSWSMNPVNVKGKNIQSLKLRADEHYLPVLEIPLKEGRNFSAALGTDAAQSVIVNESFVRAAGWKNPIGQQLLLPGEWEGDLTKNVVGVIKDYHYNSLKEKIGPQVLVMKHYENLWVKTKKDKTIQAVTAIESVYKKYLADSPFQFSFLENDIKKQYQEERRWQQILGYATVLAILISCLGLFSLSHLATRQRIREIGIRKVLGASVAGIVSLLTKDFLKLVIIAFLIASPVAWVIMHNWLQDFAYRAGISWWIFTTAGLLAIFIALFTICFQAIKAAIVNPVQNLRTD